MALMILAGAATADAIVRAVDLNRLDTATTDAGNARASVRLVDDRADTALATTRLNCFTSEAGATTADAIVLLNALLVFSAEGALTLDNATRKKLATRVIVAGSATIE